MIEYLRIKEIEVPEDQLVFEVLLKNIIPQGSCCGGSFSDTQQMFLEHSKLKSFMVPLDGSVMRFDQWVTRDNLETPFRGVDRTKDVYRLAGVVHKVSNKIIYYGHATLDLLGLLAREGASIDVLLKDGDTIKAIQLDTWSWVTKSGKRVALICNFPGFNGVLKN